MRAIHFGITPRPTIGRKLRAGIFVCVVVSACASTPPDPGQEVVGLLQDCYTSLQIDATRWCLGVMYARGFVMVRQVAGGEPQVSAPLPIRGTLSPKMVEQLGYGFDSLWLSYSGHPMGILRIDPDTLAVQARILVDTGWSSRHFGSLGEIAVGNSAVWALADGRLHRIDPSNNTISATAKFSGARGVAAGQGAIWIALVDRVVKVDPGTLDILQTFTLPAGTTVTDHVTWGKLSRRVGRIVADETSVLVPLSVSVKGFWSCGSNCPQALIGRLDPATSTVLVHEDLRARVGQ